MIHILIILIFIGVGLWLVNTIIPMVGWMRTLINVVVALFVVIWLLNCFGFDTGFRVPVR